MRRGVCLHFVFREGRWLWVPRRHRQAFAPGAGSAVADGKLDEREYLLMYPALVRVLGEDFDFTTVKASFEDDRESTKALQRDTEEMARIYSTLDDTLREDLLLLCLCVVSVDGRISLKERNYLR